MRPQAAYIITLVCLASLLAVTPDSAQQSAFALYLGGGGLTTITDLNTAGTEFLRGGLFVAGGVNWRAISDQPDFLVQGDVMWNKQELHTPKAGSGTKVDLFFFGLNLDYTYLTTGRLALGLSGGGGAVAMRVADTTGSTVGRPFARLGLGARYQVGPRLRLSVQGFGLVYELRGFRSGSVLGSFARRQSAVGIGASMSLEL
jgi:hypothetical protein